MEDFFEQIVNTVLAAGLSPSDFRLVKMDQKLDGTPGYIDYPAMWYYYHLVGMSPKEALLTNYPELSSIL